MKSVIVNIPTHHIQIGRTTRQHSRVHNATMALKFLLIWPGRRLIMAALRSRCGHYIFAPWFLSSFFPRLISAVTDWMSTILPHMVWPYSANLECMSEMCCMWLAENTGRKNDAKNCHLHSITQICRPYLRNSGTHWQSEKNLLNSNISSTCPHNMVNFGPLAAEIGSLGHPG